MSVFLYGKKVYDTNSPVRIGFVSSYNAETGMASIYYPDRCDEVTDELPVMAPFGLLQTLNKDDAVFVIHLSNGSEAGVVLGSYSVAGDIPEASITASDGELHMKDKSGSTTLGELLSRISELEKRD